MLDCIYALPRHIPPVSYVDPRKQDTTASWDRNIETKSAVIYGAFVVAILAGTAQLDKWRDDTKAAPRWTRVWGEKLRIYLDNQKALANTQMARLADYLTFIPSSSSVL